MSRPGVISCETRKCIYYRGIIGPTSMPVYVCLAFPDGIPDDVITGGNLHTEPIDGDGGYQFSDGSGRKSESVEALIRALELNPFHEPGGSPIGGRFAKSNTSTPVSLARFTETRDDNIPADFRAFVTAYTPKEYREMGVRTYVSKGGKSGYAIKKDGDIISVFSSEGKGKLMIADAVKRGGNKLDCFDGFLPSFYGKFGFKETGRYKWDDQYKPQGWNTAKHDNPDVVLMELSR